MESGYEKYSEILEIIEKQCNDENLYGYERKNRGRDFKENKEKSRHYILDNGLNVYVNSNEIIISNDALKDFTALKQNKNIETFMSINKVEKECKLYMEKNSNYFGEIIYTSQNKEDYYFLPSDCNYKDSSSQDKYELFGEISDNVNFLLEEALQRTDNMETADIYSEAIELYDKIMQVRDKALKEEKISQIIEAQQKGKALDEQLRNINNKSREEKE